MFKVDIICCEVYQVIKKNVLVFKTINLFVWKSMAFLTQNDSTLNKMRSCDSSDLKTST